VPGKCTTVIVVNWAEIGRSMTDRKFRVQSFLFRSLCIIIHFYDPNKSEENTSNIKIVFASNDEKHVLCQSDCDVVNVKM
jgi:hypothetical protein